jgi:multidrug efflux pump subunit AcrA (membrane-fusion protein)
VRYVGLADVKYPEVITNAQENAAERREKIQQEEAQLEISKVALERQLQEQQLQRKIEVEKAQAEAEVNRILAESITPSYVKYRSMQIMEKIAESDNKVFVPTEMLDSVAGQVQLGRQ